MWRDFMQRRLRETATAFRREAESWEEQAAIYRQRADDFDRQAEEWAAEEDDVDLGEQSAKMG